MKRLFSILLVIGTLFSCNKTDSDIYYTNNPILFELSIDSDETITDTESGRTYNYITTSSYDYKFNIISGNGDYKVIESNDCRVNIENEDIIVNMYREHSNLILEDSEGLQKLVWIKSSNDMFNIMQEGFGLHLSLHEGNTNEHTFDFGIGDYTIECIKGNSAIAEFVSDDRVKFTPKRRGTTHFNVKDGRGMSIPYEVKVLDNIDMRDNFCNVDVIAEDCLYLLIDKVWSWDIQSVKANSIFENVTLYNGDDYSKDFDYILIDIADDVERDETGWVKLVSNGGLEVDIIFNVK